MAAPQSEPDSDRARELPPEPKEPESPEPNTAEDGAKCRQGPGNSRAIKVAGRNHDEVIDIDDGAAVVRVTGTNNVVTIRIPDGGEADLQALCIFVAGDGNRVRLEVAGKLAGLAYVARGNQSVLDVSVAATGQMGAASLDLAGNQAKVKVSGDGTYSCPKSPTLAGNAPQIECAERRESPAER
jgi:hypothetical protein